MTLAASLGHNTYRLVKSLERVRWMVVVSRPLCSVCPKANFTFSHPRENHPRHWALLLPSSAKPEGPALESIGRSTLAGNFRLA